MNNVRFFTKINGEGEHVKLMFIIIDDKNKEIYEFKVINGKLVQTSEVMQSLIEGSTNIDEISRSEAKNFYPDINIAFLLRNYKDA